MPVLAYADTGFGGDVARLQPGFYSGRGLQGGRPGSSYTTELDNDISSIRVDPGYIAVLFGGHAPSASGGGARVLVGPQEYSDLAAIGMNDRVSSIQVYSFSQHTSAVPRDFGVTLYNAYGRLGRGFYLGQGDFDQARLASVEVGLYGDVRSVCVGGATLAVLYAGPNFDSSQDAIVVAGPLCIDDLSTVGMDDRVHSVQVLYTADGNTVAPSARSPSASSAPPSIYAPPWLPWQGGGSSWITSQQQAPMPWRRPVPGLPPPESSWWSAGFRNAPKKRSPTPFILVVLLVVLALVIAAVAGRCDCAWRGDSITPGGLVA